MRFVVSAILNSSTYLKHSNAMLSVSAVSNISSRLFNSLRSLGKLPASAFVFSI
ncbi:hypothetical protein N41_0116 [Lactococcus cremoris]|nr:hypothetical protein N41_0116 [Lactococcus cremoris]